MAEPLSFAARFALTIVIVLIILFALAAFGYFGGRWDDGAAAAPAPAPCISQADQEKILRMSIAAVDQAFQNHVNHLFSNWVLDAAEQPSRAQRGMQNGIKAWLRAQDDARKWLPPICP